MAGRNTFAERLRWSGYFALDALKGGAVRKRMDKDAYAFKHGSDIEETKERIRSLIAHAAETTGFYAKYGKDAQLSDLPIVNKDTWRADYNAFLSSKYKDDPGNRVMTTSGSTGTPFAMTQDPKGTAARIPARIPSVLPPVRYQVFFAPNKSAVRSIASFRIPSAKWRSSVPSVSVRS